MANGPMKIMVRIEVTEGPDYADETLTQVRQETTCPGTIADNLHELRAELQGAVERTHERALMELDAQTRLAQIKAENAKSDEPD